MSKTVLMLLLIISTACTKVYVDDRNPLSPSNPIVPNQPNVNTDRVEFRVLGNASNARIRHSNTLDGLTQVTSVLPYTLGLDFDRSNIFLQLEATPGLYPATITFPFISIQIFVNGAVFREAASANFLNDTISVSGTFRR